MNIDFLAPLPELAVQIHQFNVDAGWWDEYKDDKFDRFETAMMLVVSELSEALEGCRKNLMDDKLPDFKMFDVELADASLRLLDMAGAYIKFENPDSSLIYDEPIPNALKQKLKDSTKPEQLWTAVTILSETAFSQPILSITRGILVIREIAKLHDINLTTIMRLKTEFNASRQDHKLENREKEGGKKF